MKRLYRGVSLILALAMLGSALFAVSAAAETQTAEADYAVLDNLIQMISANMPEGRVLEDEESVNAYCTTLYGYIDPSQVDGVFYGGEEDAQLLLPWLSTLIYQDETMADIRLKDAALFYVCVWTIMHADAPDQYKSRPYIKETMLGVFEGCPEKAVSDSADLCVDYIINYEPDLDVGYVMNSGEITVTGSEAYKQYYQEGVRLFDEGNYQEAIEAYLKCLDDTPNDVGASMEIVEAYIALRDYTNAKEWLAGTAPYLEQDTEKARWLRRNGFIAIEERAYEAAFAYYAYSLRFEEYAMARDEIAYILSIAPDTKQFTAEEAAAYLKELGIELE